MALADPCLNTGCRLYRQYDLRYFVTSHHLKIVDTKTSRVFLRKSECPAALSAKDFHVGANVLIYDRYFELLDYLDPKTAKVLGCQQQKSVLIIKANMVAHIGSVLTLLSHKRFSFVAIKMMHVEKLYAEELLELYRETDCFDSRVDQIAHAPVIAIELLQIDCIKNLQEIVTTLSTQFNAQAHEFECAESILEAQVLRRFYLELPHASTATFANCTCCVVLPHVIKEDALGNVVAAIQCDTHVRITAMEMFYLDRTTACEFLEIYEGIVPHFYDIVDQFISGPCLALEVVGHDTSDVVKHFRAAAGPWDVAMAQTLYPQSIRAMYGHDCARNAVHCTDLTEDAELECQYFFDILSWRYLHG